MTDPGTSDSDHDTRPRARPTSARPADVASAVDLSWIPLGAGSPVVQASGRAFEAIAALRQGRPRCDLYHAALEVRPSSGRFAIEQAPVPDDDGERRGVVAVGPVGVRAAGRWRWFRYEVRCWRDGVIPDLVDAVDSPVHLSDDTGDAERILQMLPTIPTLVWGRDESGTGEMWNSNSVVAWVLTRCGIDTVTLFPPTGGRAPGWSAGRSVAERERRQAFVPSSAPGSENP